MSHIPTENKMHSNNKLLRLTCQKKKAALLATCFEKYTQYGWARLCYNVPTGDFLATCDLSVVIWNPTWALKPSENYVQTRLFPQQPVQNVSLKQRKCTIFCSVPKL